MKKIYVSCDEVYPYYFAWIEEKNEANAEISDEEWEDYRQICEKFDMWQEKLAKLLGE